LLAQQNAEVLAGLVLHQLANPGSPVVYGTFSGGFDMRYAKLALGGPELSLITCATQQLCNHYGIPMGYATGGVTDSPLGDIQAGIEKTFGGLSAALAGVEMIHDGSSGLLGAGLVTSLEQCVIDHDICASISYFLQGIPVCEESLAEDLISSVGPGGNFMTTDHTAAFFRKSLFITPLRARNVDPKTNAESKSHISEEAFKHARKLLAAHQTTPITEEQRLDITNLLREAEMSIHNKGRG
jgi:trimethylamine--corrinoid protein Co-methyltransferase